VGMHRPEERPAAWVVVALVADPITAVQEASVEAASVAVPGIAVLVASAVAAPWAAGPGIADPASAGVTAPLVAVRRNQRKVPLFQWKRELAGVWLKMP